MTRTEMVDFGANWCGCRDTAEDAVQEATIEVWKKPRRMTDSGWRELVKWNLIKQNQRLRTRRQSILEPDTFNYLVNQQLDEDKTALCLAIHHAVEMALDRHPVEVGIFLRWHDGEGLTELAQHFGMKSKQVAQQRKKKGQKILQEYIITYANK